MSPYDAGFEQHLIDNGIYPHGYEHLDDRYPLRPSNWEEINQALARPRPSLSPSRFSVGAFQAFERANWRSYNEDTVTSDVLSIIAGDVDIPSRKDVQYTNLKALTDDTITAPKPDFYDGARPERLDLRVRNQLSPYIVPSKNHTHPALPNFFAEVKGPDGNVAVARRQACYDGAVGARGMLYARSYASSGATEFDGNAYCITATYHDGTLKLYTTHATQPAEPGGNPHYHMSQLGAVAMVHTADTFRQAAGAFRNARDWAKEQRDNVISLANQKANSIHLNVSGNEPPGSKLPTSFASEAPPQVFKSSVDEALYTIGSSSQQTSFQQTSFTSDAAVHKFETSTDEPPLNLKLSAKRSSAHLEPLQQPQRKRRALGTKAE